MDQEVVKVVASIITGFIGLAIFSVLFSRNSNALGLVQNISTGVAQDISAATAPVTSSGFTLPNYTFAQSSPYV